MSTLFNADEWHRYTRHIQLPQIGAIGQTKLKNAHVLIVGAGGLGSPVALYLAAAGVGTITIIDGDHVELTNLQRQILFNTNDIGHSKALIAKEKLLALNPEINVKAIEADFSLENADVLVERAQLVLDCTDNFETRYLINDICAAQNKPWLFASIFQFSGQCALFSPDTACFRCLFPEMPSTALDCNAAGVLGVLPGLLGTIQANEAIKYLVDLPCPLKNTLLIVEAIELSTKKIRLAKNPECQSCGHHQERKTNKADYNRVCVSDVITESELSMEQFLLKGADSYQLIDVRTPAERAGFNIGGQHIPLDTLSDNLEKIKTKKELVIVCQSGVRSAKAVEQLKQAGINSASLQGGLAQWLKASIKL